MGSKFAAEPGQIESSVNLPHHVIFGNCIAKTKLVEQLTLVTLQTAHHGSTSPGIASTQRNHASRSISTDFCNKIGTKRTCRAPRALRSPRSSAGLESRCGRDSPNGRFQAHTASERRPVKLAPGEL